MALHFNIGVNGELVGRVHIVRNDAAQTSTALYRVAVEYPLGEYRRGMVEHRPEDGALVLIAKALANVQDGEEF